MISIKVVSSTKRKRSIAMHVVGNREIELRIPTFMRLTDIAEFLSNNSKFLSKSIGAKVSKRQNGVVKKGDKIFIFGDEYVAHFNKSRKTEIKMRKERRVVEIFKSGTAAIQISKFYEQTNKILLPIMAEYSEWARLALNAPRFNKVRLKKVKSIWGSCSSTKNLTYNSRLIHYPERVLRYIAVHEVAHLIEQNHSKRFWNLVESVIPEHKEIRKELKSSKFG